MITPRQTRLYRAADLFDFQRALCHLSDTANAARAGNAVVIVPTVAAARQLERTFDSYRRSGRKSAADAQGPQILTRSEWYDDMQARLASAPRRLTELEREVLLHASARDVIASPIGAPFKLRPGLLVEMLGLYDDLHRRDSTVSDFERILTRELEPEADVDRGAERLLWQTRFLCAAFRGYEMRRDATDAADEHTLRQRLIAEVPLRPLRHVVVSVGERSVDPSGLWPADLDLLTRLPQLEQIDIVATQRIIAAGLLERLQRFVPGFEDVSVSDQLDQRRGSHQPVVGTADDGRPYSVERDREEELTAVAATVKARGDCELDRCAVIFKRPLPYVYLARQVFGGAGLRYHTYDALPLAAEPFAAALDVVFEFVTSNFTRTAVVALLKSPHFVFEADAVPITPSDVAELNRALSEAGYFGGASSLATFGRRFRAARAAAAAAAELQFLTELTRPSMQLESLAMFLDAHARPIRPGDPLAERYLRTRAAVMSAIEGLRRAHDQLDDTPAAASDIALMIRRWIEGQTFAPEAGEAGIQLLDAQAARYGEFDDVFLVGLVDGEWPHRSSKNIFYPSWLLSQLDWPDSRMARAAERAAFQDLAMLARRRVQFSTFELEDDAIVAPSVFLEDLDRLELASEPAPLQRKTFTGEVSNSGPASIAANWLSMRMRRADHALPRFHGTAVPYSPPTYSISSLEQYLQCPFKYFSDRVLGLEEDPEDEAAANPRDLGIFVHDVFRNFFEEWKRQGHGAITPHNLSAARTIFQQTVEPALATLREDIAAVQRARLLGSAVDKGLAEAVFQVEAEWETPVVERLLEYPLNGEFEITAEGQTRRIALRGKADRIDLLRDGTFRIIDYKLNRAPDRKRALQLPIYSVCTSQHLRTATGREWAAGEAGYIAFGEARQFVPMLGRGQDRSAMLLEAQTRLANAVDNIARGEFPPTPADEIMCLRCAYAAVCRKDYVGV